MDSVGEVKADVRDIDKRVRNLVSQFATSGSASNATIDAIQGNISTLLTAQELMQAKLTTLKEENSSMHSIVNALSNDVKNGKKFQM